MCPGHQVDVMKRHLTPLALLAILASACMAPEHASLPAGPDITDSAGVRIVAHPEAQWSDTISGPPMLTVGQEGDPDYEFFRVTRVLALSSGNLVVVDGAARLRFYGPDGRHIRDVGRRGEGPSEFGFLSDVWLREGDTLAVLDSGRRRVALFDSAGQYAGGRSFSSEISGDVPPGRNLCAFPGLSGEFADGTLAVRGWSCLTLMGSAGMRLWPNTLLRGDVSGDTLVVMSARVWEREGATDTRQRYAFLPFSGLPSVLVQGDRLLVSRGEAYEIEIHDSYGRLLEVWREAGEPPAVTEEMKDRYRQEQADLGRPHPEDVPFSQRLGGYASLVASPEGSVWAEWEGAPRDAHERRWTVFSPDGTEVRHLVLPALGAESVGADRLVGVRTDSLDIQHIVVYDIGGYSPGRHRVIE